MAKLRNNRNICLFCFGDLDEHRVCTKCGKASDDKDNLPHHLKKRSLLAKRYLIDHAIGEGGFGITYVAWDTVEARKVAIKEYYPSGYVSRDPRSPRVIINARQNHAASNRGLKRFIEEADNLTKVNDLNGIVSVYDFFSANNTAYIVMEFLDGISLKRYIKRKGKLSMNTALTILKPVILSLAKVHETGLIHRDISPDNILITKSNEVKLIDFGASKHANPGGEAVSIVLKQGFAPEEQYRLHGKQGPWTDIYAMGVTLYYCITGQLPPESIQRMYDDTIIAPKELGAKVTLAQQRALMKALAVFAKDRYQNVDEFVTAIYAKEKREELPEAVPAESEAKDEPMTEVKSKEAPTEAKPEEDNATPSEEAKTAPSEQNNTTPPEQNEPEVTEQNTAEETASEKVEEVKEAIKEEAPEIAEEVNAPTAEPVVEVKPEPTAEPAVEVKPEPTAEPAVEVKPEPTPEPIRIEEIKFNNREVAVNHRITPDSIKMRFSQKRLDELNALNASQPKPKKQTDFPERTLTRERTVTHETTDKTGGYIPRTTYIERKFAGTANVLKEKLKRNK